MNLTPQETLQAISDGKNLEFKEPHSASWRSFTLDRPIFISSVVNGCFIFRLAQEMVTIGAVSFPKPETTPPALGTRYWVPDPTSNNLTGQSPSKWENDSYDNRFLSRGFVHLSEKNAIAHAKALIKLSGGKYR